MTNKKKRDMSNRPQNCERPLTVPAELFIRMEARGAKRPEIFKEVFGVDIHEISKAECMKYDNQLVRWRKHSQYKKVWDDEVHKCLRKLMGKAMGVVEKSMDNTDLPWLQLNAANTALAQAGKMLYSDDDRNVIVKVEGMPTLGKPDADEAKPVESGTTNSAE